MTLGLIVISSLAAYLVGAGVAFGIIDERDNHNSYQYDAMTNVFIAAGWPLVVLWLATRWVTPRVLLLPVKAGRRLAKPRPQLPEARVVSEGDPGRTAGGGGDGS